MILVPRVTSMITVFITRTRVADQEQCTIRICTSYVSQIGCHPRVKVSFLAAPDRPSSLKFSLSPSHLLLLPFRRNLTRQIRVEYSTHIYPAMFHDTTKILLPKMRMNLEKLVQRCPYLQSQMHSEDGELRKMLTSPLYRQDREDCRSSRIPTAPGKPAAMIQERGANASVLKLIHLRNREERGNLL